MPLKKLLPQILVALFVSTTLLTTKVHAWNAAGHRLSAVIAWQTMGPESQRQAEALLADHPAASRWHAVLLRGREGLAPTGADRLAEASTWADDLRREARLDDEAGHREDVVHRDWHYVNWPVNGGPASTRGGRLDVEMIRQRKLLEDPATGRRERAIALAWLVHLVGDAHQPLHVASWTSSDGRVDDGGLDTWIRDPQKPKLDRQTLHGWWDELPGPPWLRGKKLHRRAFELLLEHPAAGIQQASARTWLAESLALARERVRRPAAQAESGEAWTVSDAERDTARAIAARRITEAGVRLGRLLDAALGPPPGKGQTPANETADR